MSEGTSFNFPIPNEETIHQTPERMDFEVSPENNPPIPFENKESAEQEFEQYYERSLEELRKSGVDNLKLTEAIFLRKYLRESIESFHTSQIATEAAEENAEETGNWGTVKEIELSAIEHPEKEAVARWFSEYLGIHPADLAALGQHPIEEMFRIVSKYDLERHRFVDDHKRIERREFPLNQNGQFAATEWKKEIENSGDTFEAYTPVGHLDPAITSYIQIKREQRLAASHQ